MRFFAAVLVALLLPAVLAAPTLVYPLQAQRPPVARTGEPWTFALLSGTFSSSSGGTVSLAAGSNVPSWATFDPASATFSGTPPSSDIGSTVVSVRATDANDGVSATGRFTLLVVDSGSEPAPYVRLPLSEQLERAAAVSGGGTLTPGGALKVPPQWSFSFGFQQYTIENAQRQRMYYSAFERGTTTLPSWIQFDNQTVTFGGLAPYSDGEYEIDLVASERFGYGDARQSFRISVTTHSFELVQSNGTGVGVFPSVNATVGGPVNYTVPLDQLRLDNSTVERADLSSISLDLTAASFLQFDPSNLTVSGEVPASFAPTGDEGLSLPLSLVDQYNNTLQANLSLVVSASVFDSSAFPANIDVQVGKKFEQDLGAFLASSSTTPSRTKRALPSSLKDTSFSTTVSPESAASWVTFDASTFTLSGTAPDEIPSYQNASVTLDALDPSTSAVSRASFVLSVIEGGGNSTHPTSSPSMDKKGLSHDAKLGLGIGLGLGLPLLIAALVLLACCYRRKRRDGPAGGKNGGLLISHPRPLNPSVTGSSPDPTAYSSSALTIAGTSPSMYEKDGSPVAAREKWDSPSKKHHQLAPPVAGAEQLALPITVVQHRPLTTLHEADEPPPTPTTPHGHPLQPPNPSRFDIMGRLFRSDSGGSVLDAMRGGVAAVAGFASGKGKDRSAHSLGSPQRSGNPPLPHESSLYGLGIDDDADEPRRIVVVSEGGRGGDGTYSAGAATAGPAAGASGRVSSWESGASSSLFYSDRSAPSPAGSSRSVPHRRTTSRSGSGSGLGSGFGSPTPSSSGSIASSGARSAGGTRRGPGSVPQRRRDFLPLPPRSPTASPGGSPAPSPTRDTYDVVARPPYAREESEEQLQDGAVEEDEMGGGIRMVASHSDSTTGSSGRGEEQERSEELLDASVAYSEHQAQHFQQYSSPSRSGSYPSEGHSSESHAPARLIAFTQERRPPPFSRTLTSQTSLAARRPSEPTDAERDYDDDAVEDAWEDDEDADDEAYDDEGRPRPRSGVYAPPEWEGSPTTSAVFYPSASASNRETWRSRSAYGESVLSRTSFDDEQRLSAGGVRYVGSVASTQVSPYMPSSFTHDSASHYSHDVPPTPRSDVFSAASSQPTAATSSAARSSGSPSHHKRTSSYLEPLRVQLYVNEPFRFVPRLDPPPFASITASPGRSGPPRVTYHAYVELSRFDQSKRLSTAPRADEDDEDEGIADLPSWVHFDGGAIEVYGLARRVDVGSLPVIVVERKEQRTTGSPTRSGSPVRDVTEQVVGRFDLVVGHRESVVVERAGAAEEDEGELRIVTY
ncbi:Axl2p [Rhodotorula paludigena]|uniref:Axl2p n=1 Tax=Rhodotorula paludigena TaxID=86838 RepID=UPI00316B88B2